MKRIFAVLAAIFLFPSLGHADTESEFYDGSIIYLNNLKTCTPYTFTYRHPFVENFTAQNAIKGQQGGKCFVTTTMPKNMQLECQLSPDTINLMTSEAKYRELRKHEMSGSTSDPASTAANRECTLLRDGKPIQ